MNSLLDPSGVPEGSDPRHMHYDREREREREREWEWEREREREREWERERERDRARGGMFPGGPSSRTGPPPSHPNDRRSPMIPYGQTSTSPSSQAPTRKWSDSNPEDAPPGYHREREWEREREYEIEREREMRWRASQRAGGGSDIPPSQHGRVPSGDMRYAAGGQPPSMPGEPARSPREPYPASLPPRRSPAPGHGGRAGPVGGRVREPSADVPLAAMGPERSPRHAPYPGPYDDPRAGSLPPGHGGMLPPAGRSPERMRAPLSYSPYDANMSEREMMQREREREMMAGDRYGRRMHGEPMMVDEPMYDRYGPRGPPSGPLGPLSAKSASGRGAYDDRGPPSLPYPPPSPTQSRDGDRRKEKAKPVIPQPSLSANASRESSVPAQSRPGAYSGRPDERAGTLPSHFEPERHPRSGPPPPMGPGQGASIKTESAAGPPRRAPLSPSSERGSAFRDGPPHRGMPPYGGPPSERDLRDRDREMAMQRDRELEAEHERERMRQREREREIEQERSRDLERERERLRLEELERERQRERDLELEREREKEREKEKDRERRERRREKQQAEKMAAMEREQERERHAQAAQAQAQAQAHAAAAAAAQMHPGALGELPPHIRPPPASLEEALIATAQQQAAAYGRPPTMADFHAAAATIGYPPGMPLPPAIHPAMFGGVGPGAEALVPHQPHVIRDPNAGPRVDSEPVWLYLELCERDESIRRAERLPLDVLADDQKDEVAAELAGVAPPVTERAAAMGTAPEAAAEESTAGAAEPSAAEEANVGEDAEASKAATKEDASLPAQEALVDPLPRHLIGMDKGRPVRHLGSWVYDPTVDPLFPAELLARNVGATLEVRIPGDLLGCGGRGGPHWDEYRSLDTECLARCDTGDPLKDLLEGDRGRLALNGTGNNWKLGWRGKEHARMSLEMRIEERVAEAQLFGQKIPPYTPKTTKEAAAQPADQKGAEDDEAKAKESAPDHANAENMNGKAPKELAGTVSPWRFWRLNPLLRRKLWGTDVYTDDSDVLAMCVHAGWVEGPSLEAEGIPAWVPPGRAARAWNGFTATADSKTIEGADVAMEDATENGKEEQGADATPAKAQVSCDLSVILRIAPKLIAYKGCQRGGIKSRSWGNSHDGVSLVVESVELKQPGYAQSKGRRSAKARIDQLAWYRSAVDFASSHNGVASPSSAVQSKDGGDDGAQLDLKAIMRNTQLIPLSSVVRGIKRSHDGEQAAEATDDSSKRLFWEIQ